MSSGRDLQKGLLDIRLFILLLALALLSAYFAPEEESLGQRYKLVFLHLPLLALTFGSFYLSSILAILRIRRPTGVNLRALLSTGLIFAAFSLAVVYAFEVAAWGAFTAAEPRFQFMAIVYLAMVVLLALEFIGEELLSASFSLLALTASAYLVLEIFFRANFQLHPLNLVTMPLEMVIPLVLSFALMINIFIAVLLKLDSKVMKE